MTPPDTLTPADLRCILGDDRWMITRDIPLPTIGIGAYRVEASVCASGLPGAVRVQGNYKIFEGDRLLTDQRGVPIRNVEDIEASARRWLAKWGQP
jgi:hypothetical protein